MRLIAAMCIAVASVAPAAEPVEQERPMVVVPARDVMILVNEVYRLRALEQQFRERPSCI